MSLDNKERLAALNRFEEARRRARREELAARLAGREARLLPFEAIRTRLRQKNPMYAGVHDIPLDRIAGSVGRYGEFTRQFLPLNDGFGERWVRLEQLANSKGWPPIDVYEIGDVYFVMDGNHRVAIARQLPMETIEAHVWQFPEDVTLVPEASLDETLIRLGESHFLQQTGLDQLFPGHGLHLTTPGRYEEILAQIEGFRETLSQIDGETMSYREAVAAWYEMIYLPTIQIIHDANILRQFPGRTEADLFVWLSLHSGQLADIYGEFANLMVLATVLANHYGQGPVGRLASRARRLLGRAAAGLLRGFSGPV